MCGAIVWHPRLEEVMVSTGDLDRILCDCVARSWSGSLLQIAQMCIVGSRAVAAHAFLAALLNVAWILAFTSVLDPL